MPELWYDYFGDPFAADAISGSIQITSNYYSGTYSNIFVRNSPNFPINTPTRYFIKLPFIPYIDDTSLYPILLRDVTSGINLTKVSGTPGTNEYRVGPIGLLRPDIVEVNSAKAGKEIGYSYYIKGTIFNKDTFKTDRVYGSGSTLTLNITPEINGFNSSSPYEYEVYIIVKSSGTTANETITINGLTANNSVSEVNQVTGTYTISNYYHNNSSFPSDFVSTSANYRAYKYLITIINGAARIKNITQHTYYGTNTDNYCTYFNLEKTYNTVSELTSVSISTTSGSFVDSTIICKKIYGGL